MLGYLGFIVTYVLGYRDYSTMKDIFVFPAALGFADLLARGIERADARSKPGSWISRASWLALALLAGCYVADQALLIAHLA